MQVALICSSPVQNFAYLKKRLPSFSQCIAVDGGANHCKAAGITPNLIVGDLDSIDPDTLNHFKKVPLKLYPKEKNHTDVELALKETTLENVVLFCALGGRLDHTLNHLNLLAQYPGKLFIESENERCFVISQKAELECTAGQLISLMPLNGPVTQVTTSGLKWELENATLVKKSVSISNEATSTQVKISVGSGDLLCIIQMQ